MSLQIEGSLEPPAVLFGHKLYDPIAGLKGEVESAADQVGYRLAYRPMPPRAQPDVNGVTRFVDRTTIAIVLNPGVSEENFNATLAEELVHAWQNVQHYPKMRPRNEFFNQQTREFADEVSTRILDIHAHMELRMRGISTQALGIETYQNDHEGLLAQVPPAGIDEFTGRGKLSNALIFVRLFFELHEDPEIPPYMWEEADGWFSANLPMTRALGEGLATIIRDEGFSEPDACKRIYKRVLEQFDFKTYFELFGGPPSRPSYVELLSP